MQKSFFIENIITKSQFSPNNSDKITIDIPYAISNLKKQINLFIQKLNKQKK